MNNAYWVDVEIKGVRVGSKWTRWYDGRPEVVVVEETHADRRDESHRVVRICFPSGHTRGYDEAHFLARFRPVTP